MGGYADLADHKTEFQAAISDALFDNEQYQAGIRCADAIRSKKQTRLILTTKRLLVLKPTRSARARVVDAIDRETINDIEYDTGMVTKTLRIRTADGVSTEWDLDLQDGDEFVARLETTFSAVEQSPSYSGQHTLNADRQAGLDQYEHADKRDSGTPDASTGTRDSAVVMDFSEHELKERLREIDSYQFEHFVADLWERRGWTTTVSQAVGDAGIDVIAEKSAPYPQKKVIQVKRYGADTTVGGPDIQQYASLRHQVTNTDSVIVVTTSRFTSSARDRAQDLNVKLIDGDGLVSMIDTLEARDLVAEYLDLPLHRPDRKPEADADIQAGAGRPFDPTPTADSGSTSSTAESPVDHETYPSGSDQHQQAEPFHSRGSDHRATDISSAHSDNDTVETNRSDRPSSNPQSVTTPDTETSESIADKPKATETGNAGTNWKFVAGATALWWGAIFLGEVATTLSSLAILAGWFGLPYAHYRDRAWLGRWWIGYAAIALIPALGLFSGPAYLIHRYLRVGLAR